MSNGLTLGRNYAALAAFFALPAGLSWADDIIAGVEHQASLDYQAQNPVSGSTANYVLGQFDPDTGAFANADYTNTGSLAIPAVNDIQYLAMAYAEPNVVAGSITFTNNPTIASDIFLGTQYWVTQDPTVNQPSSGNWYYNNIAMPNEFSRAYLVLHATTPTLLASGGGQSAWTNVQPLILRAQTPPGTGLATADNLLEEQLAVYNLALVNQDHTLLSNTLTTIKGLTAKVSRTTEGLQADGSFHQHGAQLYQGTNSYGYAFGNHLADVAYETRGTIYAFSQANKQGLIDYLLDGQQWFTYGNEMDMISMGRGITGYSSVGGGARQPVTALATAVSRAAQIGANYRTTELTNFSNRLANPTNASYALNGTKYFFDSDAFVQNRSNYYASVKMLSNRTLQPESLGANNMKGLLEYDGMNLIKRTGDEYDDIQPVWDWTRLPGTTEERGNVYKSLAPASNQVAGTNASVGGLSDGKRGMAAQRFSRTFTATDNASHTVQGDKAWFFFDGVEIALGSSIYGTNTTGNIETSINQSLYKTAVTYESSTGTVQTMASPTASSAAANPANLRWVNHDGIGYFFLNTTAGGLTTASNVIINAKTQTGDWKDLNAGMTSVPASANVFSLDINHGTAPVGARYAYAVVPNLTTSAQMDNYFINNPAHISVLSNTYAIQAVEQNDNASEAIVQSLFKVAGSVGFQTLSGASHTLQYTNTNGGALVMFDQLASGSIQLSASSLEALSYTLTLKVDLDLTGPNATYAGGWTTINFALPSGDYAGATVTNLYTLAAGSSQAEIAVPEPTTLALLAAPLLLCRRRKS